MVRLDHLPLLEFAMSSAQDPVVCSPLPRDDGHTPNPHWVRAAAQMRGLPGGGLNIGFEAADRHVLEGRGRRVALHWLGREGQQQRLSYSELAQQSDRFASALARLGVQPGERVFLLLGRRPPLYVAALGCWKFGAVLCPLFAAFGPEPIAARMEIAEPTVLVTTSALYARKIQPLLPRLPFLREVILVDEEALAAEEGAGPRIHRIATLLARPPETAITPATDEDTLATLHFTSGTTGKPKAAMHVHAAAIAHRDTSVTALDLRRDDVFWCTADPGWVTGTSYGIVAPLLVGCTLLVDEAEFEAERWYRILESQKVTVWYTAPTAVRMLMKAGDELPQRFNLQALRFIASVGEPLNPEAVRWGQRVLHKTIHDNWWQSETGGIMIANTAGLTVKPGSMGRPLPGIEAAVVRVEDGRAVTLADDECGELALRPGWPSMFRGYLGENARYRRCFVDGWYLSGDIVRRDGDGYYWFVGRGDDVIKTSGHLIGPFEIESVLLEHPAVAEAAAIGLPDEVAGELIKAYVTLKPGHAWNEDLQRALLAHARKRLGPAVAPREIDWREELPRTRSGKILRRVLRARELGLPEGDLSTLESAR